MPFRHIVAIVVSSFVVFALVFFFIVIEFGDIPPPPSLVYFGSVFLLFWLTAIGAVLLFVYGIRGRKIQPQDKTSKEDIPRLETSINRLEKKVDEIHEYMVDMYIKHDDKL